MKKTMLTMSSLIVVFLAACGGLPGGVTGVASSPQSQPLSQSVLGTVAEPVEPEATPTQSSFTCPVEDYPIVQISTSWSGYSAGPAVLPWCGGGTQSTDGKILVPSDLIWKSDGTLYVMTFDPSLVADWGQVIAWVDTWQTR